MTREEAIALLQKIKPIPYRADGKSTTHILQTIALEMAIKALETWDNLFKSYEILTKEITESGDTKNATKRIDDWCIEQLRSIISDYYADLILKEVEP